ncbi:putative tellurite resistance protein B-like protein [Shimia isoporae]|uniref:Putative tellurite resistance protein B-like protein n=2 Tax=Shimia isoporae TaxID=647720 RepID=A0A4R1NL04_9RHOB|nr:putative tellurite resistance protein B-like protein [Shimia isoporae]
MWPIKGELEERQLQKNKLPQPGTPPTSLSMFADFLKRLTAPAPSPLDQTDARLALTALLVRIARADDHYSSAEALKIERIVTERYALATADAQNLMRDAETLEAEAPDTVRFTRAIKDAVPHEERIAVIEAMWSVVLADGERDAEEDALLRLSANLLGINDKDSALARQRVSTKQ